MAWVIRLYNHQGRLLYVAGTQVERPADRMRALRREAWWPLVDESRTLLDEAPPRAWEDLVQQAIQVEQPRYYKDQWQQMPYLYLRPRGSDHARRLAQCNAVARIAAARDKTTRTRVSRRRKVTTPKE